LVVKQVRRQPVDATLVALVAVLVHPPLAHLARKDAPEAIRGTWVGLELPLAVGETGLRPLDQIEVLSLQRTGKAQGYLVDTNQALSIL
jgi:hypothetical protein